MSLIEEVIKGVELFPKVEDFYYMKFLQDVCLAGINNTESEEFEYSDFEEAAKANGWLADGQSKADKELDTALLKALYLSTFEATKKWTMPVQNWGKVYGELAIMYDGRLPE